MPINMEREMVTSMVQNTRSAQLGWYKEIFHGEGWGRNSWQEFSKIKGGQIRKNMSKFLTIKENMTIKSNTILKCAIREIKVTNWK